MTTVDIPLPLVQPVTGLREWIRERLSALGRRILAIREIGIFSLMALAFYIVIGFWLRYDLHFFLNDALNRTADALYVTYSRDPHLAAIGFFWPPLPQLIQVPLMVIVEPLHLTAMAGPISSAICVAATIPVLSRIGRFLGLGRLTTIIFIIAYAFNPVTIYYAANGMSEACFFFTGSLALYGFLRYIRDHRISDMWIFSWGLAGCVLTRLEGPLFAVVLAVVAAFSWRVFISKAALKQAVWTTFLIGLPALASFGVWMAVQWAIEGSATYFLQTGTSGPPVRRPGVPPLHKEPWAAFPWAFNRIAVFGAILILLSITIIIAPLSKRTRGSIGIVLAMCVFAGIQIDSIAIEKSGYGNPRYFVVAVPFSVIGAMWLASSGRHVWSQAWNAGIVAVLLANWYTGTRYESSGYVTDIEHECAFFQYGVARVLPSWGTGGNPHTGSYCPRFPNALQAYQDAANYLDRVLKPSDRVFTDNSSVFEPDLLSTKPGQFIVRNDRDFQKIADDPVDYITYIVTHGTSATSGPLEDVGALNGQIAGTGGADVGEQIIVHNPQDWTLVGAWESLPGIWVQVYHINRAAAEAGSTVTSG